MTYRIAQKVYQTDYYEIEANSPEEAMEQYLKAPGLCQYKGTDGGWLYGKMEVLVYNPDNLDDIAVDASRKT